jgi:hypothetical protein
MPRRQLPVPPNPRARAPTMPAMANRTNCAP